MKSKLLIPRNVAEKIRKEGRKQLKKNREAFGFVFGEFFEGNDSIEISELSELYTLPSKNGDNKFSSNIIYGIKTILTFPKFLYLNMKTLYLYLKFRKETKTLGMLLYHSHTNDSYWSDSDLNGIKIFSFGESKIKTTALLYLPNRDTFLAIDNKKNSLNIEFV